ncbi:MAG: hypothetical protein JWP81_4378 [Ferruginibacter sp.]|nr:hypothetical protein [Ferruginibacter sp.]
MQSYYDKEKVLKETSCLTVDREEKLRLNQCFFRLHLIFRTITHLAGRRTGT